MAKLLRCPSDAPTVKCRVELMVLHANEVIHQQIGGHHDVYADGARGREMVEQAPWVGTEKPFEGELCEHELQFLNGVPGKDYKKHFLFTVTKLS